MIRIVAHAEGCIVPVRAQPGARRNAIIGEQAGSLKIAVTAPPDKGRANEALANLLRRCLDIKKANVELIAGHSSREKKFLLRGVDVAIATVVLGELCNRSKES